MYLTGDSARRDEDGYFWIIGRVDDVIKVSGYRLGTAEIESALVSHPAVAEAAAIGLPHEIKGHAIHAFVILRQGFTGIEGTGRGAAPARRHGDRADRQARGDRVRDSRCPRPAPARSCAACSRPAPWACPKATSPRWRNNRAAPAVEFPARTI